MPTARRESESEPIEYSEEVEPGLWVIRNLRVEQGLSKKLMRGLSAQSQTLLGVGEDPDRRRKRIRSLSGRMEEAPLGLIQGIGAR
jgi:hypothetical protein